MNNEWWQTTIFFDLVWWTFLIYHDFLCIFGWFILDRTRTNNNNKDHSKRTIISNRLQISDHKPSNQKQVTPEKKISRTLHWTNQICLRYIQNSFFGKHRTILFEMWFLATVMNKKNKITYRTKAPINTTIGEQDIQIKWMNQSLIWCLLFTWCGVVLWWDLW